MTSQIDDLYPVAQAETKLRHSGDVEVCYRLMIETSPHIIWLMKPQGEITYLNPFWYGYSGLDPEVDGLEWAKCIHPDQYQLVTRFWKHSLAQLKAFSLEILFAAQDASYRWFEARVTPAFSAAGELEGWVGNAIDIDQRKRVEIRQAFLLELTDRLQNTAKAEDVIVTLGDSLGHILQVERIGFGRLDTQGYLHIHSEWSPCAKPDALGAHRFDDFGSSLHEQLARGEVVIVDDTQTDARTVNSFDRYAEFNVRSVLLEPLFDHGRLSAVFYVCDGRPRQWSGDEVALFREVADRTRAADERTQSRTALLEAEQRFNLANSIADIGVWEYDANLDILHWDAKIKSLVGWPLDQPTPSRRALISMVHADDQARLVHAITHALLPDSAGELSLDYRMHLYDANKREQDVSWVTIRGRRLLSDDGNVRLLGTARDISIERNTEDALRRSNTELQLRIAERNRSATLQAALLMLGDLLRDQTESAAIADVATKLLGETLSLSRAAYASVDRSGKLARVATAWSRELEQKIIGIHQFSDYGTFISGLQKGEAVIVNNVTTDIRTADHAANCQALDVSSFINIPLLEHGRLHSILLLHCAHPREWTEEEISFVRDVADRTWNAAERARAETALRDSEKQFRTLADNMSQFAWTADPNGHIYWYNKRWYDYTGASLEAMLALGWRSVHHPDHVDRVVSRLNHCFATGSIWEDTFPLRGKDGKYSWFLSRALPIRDELGRITHWLGTNTDITAQFSAEEALRDLNESLELRVGERTRELASINQLLQIEMNEREQAEDALRHAQKMDAIGQLTGGIAHDFNNMLTGVLGSLDLIQRRVAAGRANELDRYIDAAMTSANRAAALTHRLLAFARRQSLNPKAVDVNRLVDSMHDLLSRTIGESIRLRIEVSETQWLAKTDEHQLENALLNLVINARDAMPDGGDLLISTGFIGIAADVDDGLDAGEYVMLAVSDSGSGMSVDVIAKIFDPFFTTKPIGQGTGLGLSMVYGFIKQTGGHVLVDSEVGRGSKVCLYLPRHTHQQESIALKVGAQNMPRAKSGETVLVVEDELAVRMLVIDVLHELGYSTLEAADGNAALTIIQSDETIDLMVSDVGLPGLNGRQLADIARQNRPALKVLFITGYARNAEVRGDFLADGMEMLAKPFNIDVLALKVREMIEK